MGLLLSVPTVSKFVTALPRDPNGPCFGYLWDERVLPLHGISVYSRLVDSESYVCDVSNVMDPTSTALWVDPDTRTFLLLPGECIERVDVCWRDGVVIKGLRVHTNQRVSEWLGDGDNGSQTTIDAPTGHYIRALYGYRSMTTLPRRCSHLGAVYAPLQALDQWKRRQDEAKAFACSMVVRNTTGAQTFLVPARRGDGVSTRDDGGALSANSFRLETCCASPRAVVIRFEYERICQLTVLTDDEYASVATADDLYIRESEGWVVLADGERLEAVALMFEYSHVAAIRFRTNLRTSGWLGDDYADAEATWLDCADQPTGSFICGFHVEVFVEDVCTYMYGLGVIYNTVDEATHVEAEATAQEASQAT